TIKQSLILTTILLAVAIVSILIQILLSIGLDVFDLFLVRTALPIVLITGANLVIYNFTATRNFCFGKGNKVCLTESKTLAWICCIGVIVALTLIPGANTFFLVIFALMFFYSLIVLSMMTCTKLIPYLVTSVMLQFSLLAGMFSLFPSAVSHIIDVTSDGINSEDFGEFIDHIKDQFNPEKYMARYLGAIMVCNYCLNLNMVILWYLHNDAQDLNSNGTGETQEVKTQEGKQPKVENTIDNPKSIYALILKRVIGKSIKNDKEGSDNKEGGGKTNQNLRFYYFTLIVFGTLNWIINTVLAMRIIYEALHIQAEIDEGNELVEISRDNNSAAASSASQMRNQSEASENRSQI
ncbi:MAG: hypothetical protein MHMPM18_002300, partial [Marteilia pararefringens]